MIAPPKKWAYLVAVAPASIVVGLVALAVGIAGLPALELFALWMVLNVAAFPLVCAGVWFDVGVVERQTGIRQKRWVWILPALFLAPLIGTLYLWTRRKYFRALDA